MRWPRVVFWKLAYCCSYREEPNKSCLNKSEKDILRNHMIGRWLRTLRESKNSLGFSHTQVATVILRRYGAETDK